MIRKRLNELAEKLESSFSQVDNFFTRTIILWPFVSYVTMTIFQRYFYNTSPNLRNLLKDISILLASYLPNPAARIFTTMVTILAIVFLCSFIGTTIPDYTSEEIQRFNKRESYYLLIFTVFIFGGIVYFTQKHKLVFLLLMFFLSFLISFTIQKYLTALFDNSSNKTISSFSFISFIIYGFTILSKIR